jgi:hypothetical protein
MTSCHARNIAHTKCLNPQDIKCEQKETWRNLIEWDQFRYLPQQTDTKTSQWNIYIFIHPYDWSVVYLTKMSVTQTVQRGVTGELVNKKLEKMCKEAHVA